MQRKCIFVILPSEENTDENVIYSNLIAIGGGERARARVRSRRPAASRQPPARGSFSCVVHTHTIEWGARTHCLSACACERVLARMDDELIGLSAAAAAAVGWKVV